MADQGNVPPSWVDQNFLEQALKTYYKDENLSLTNFSIICPENKGDNYSSIMYRASLEITTKGEKFSKNVIMKTMPTHETSIDYVNHTDSFPTEVAMLGKVVPCIEEILKEIGHSEPLAPRLLYSALEPEKIIIMEDLCESKFFVADRCEGLNLEQCLQAVRSLATFHVGSVAALQRQPDLKESLTPGFWGSHNMEYNIDLLRDGFEVLKENIDEWSGQKWSDKLERLGNVPEKMYQVYDDISKDKVTVINHGDLWTNNMMFRRRGCGLNDVRFIDFQLSACRSPVYDLQYFIFTSPKKDVRFQHMDTILKAYHDQWILTAQELQLSVQYSFNDLLNDLKEKAIFGFCMFYGVQAVVTVPKDDSNKVLDDVDNMKNSVIFKNKNYQGKIVDGLPYFNKIGLF